MKPVSFIKINSEKEHIAAQRWILATITLCMLTFIIMGFLYKPLIMQLRTQRREIRKLETVINKNKKVLDQQAYVKNMQQQYTALQNKFEHYESHPNIPIALFTNITTIAQKAGTIDQLSCNKKKISLQMHVTDLAKMTNVINELKNNVHIKKVVIASLSERNNDNKDYFVSLTITSQYQTTASKASKAKL